MHFLALITALTGLVASYIVPNGLNELDELIKRNSHFGGKNCNPFLETKDQSLVDALAKRAVARYIQAIPNQERSQYYY